MSDSEKQGILKIITFLIVLILGLCLWPYTFNSWFEYFHYSFKLETWHAILLCVFASRYTIPCAVITYILLSYL